ncbi:MAG: phosphate ABC transporter permease subunit PstC [Phycisphaerales bacterium]|nr:phosphate ABC transporter permease subunit PstC [Phycisphaerales bacterium]
MQPSFAILSAPHSPAILPPGQRRSWSATQILSVTFSVIAVGALLGMLVLFLWQSAPVWRHTGGDYVTGTQWSYRHELFGALPMIYGTVAVAMMAVLLAAPLGIGAAVFTAEFLPARIRLSVKLAIELLAGIPSVVYGLLGILLLRNYVYDGLRAIGLDPLSGDTLLTAGILLAVMILPTVMTLADDALRAVPGSQRHAARGLGLTRAQGILSVTLPQARRGLIAAVLLALGRALGETIAVFLVVGRQDNQWPESLLSLRPLIEAGQTLTSKLGGAETNIALGDPLHWAAIVGLGLLLLLIVVALTLLGAWLEGKGARRA